MAESMHDHAKSTGCCKDCGTTDGLDWSIGRYQGSGPHRCRCKPCYLAYTRRNQNARMHGRRNKTPWIVSTKLVGPPVPDGFRRLIQCVDCGVECERRSVSRRCESCSTLNEGERRGRAMARRVAAEQAGDKGIAWRAVADRDGWDCHLCGKPVLRIAGTAHEPRGATVDHLVPIVDGGTHTWDNVALAHRRCNIIRGSRGLVQLRLVG